MVSSSVTAVFWFGAKLIKCEQGGQSSAESQRYRLDPLSAKIFWESTFLRLRHVKAQESNGTQGRISWLLIVARHYFAYKIWISSTFGKYVRSKRAKAFAIIAHIARNLVRLGYRVVSLVFCDQNRQLLQTWSSTHVFFYYKSRKIITFFSRLVDAK